MAQVDPNDTVYKTRSLSKWFAIGSVLLLVATLWAVIEDYNREWKTYVRQYKKITTALAEKKLAEEEASLDPKELAKIEARIADFQHKELGNEKELQAKVDRRNAHYYKANQVFQVAKANLDADLYIVNHKTKELDPHVPELKKKWDEDARKVRELQEIANQAEADFVQAKDDLAQFISERKKLQDELEGLLRDKTRIETTIAKNEVNLGNLVRNAPLVDFISPTIKIQQVVLPDLKDDYSFNKVPRVDRCITCHANADKPGFENYPEPFKTHPRLNLYVGADSHHPIEKVGCTVCHGGIPQSVDFSLAGHTPRDAKQLADWEEKHNYHVPEHLPTPMVPTEMTEGKCIQCHARNVYLDGAPTFNAGMRIIERQGCYGCHKFAGHFERLAKEKKPGPSLKLITGKVSEDWIRKFIWEPRSFRPTTLMPQFWKTFNNSDPVSLARGAVEVDAIAHFIAKRSKGYEPLKIEAGAGDVARGKEIVGSVGCLACHAVSDFPRDNPKTAQVGGPGWRDPRVPMFGPELNQMGSKVSKAWLVSWLSNPKHYWDGTAMPSMRLKPQEATDVAAYLLSKRNTRFEQLEAPKANDGVRDAAIFSYFQAQMSDTDAKSKIASMSLEDKRLYLGEKLVNHYGCFGCHAIDGMEGLPNIGAELTYEGSKDITKFDFGNVHIEHSRPEWIYTKIRTPRIWDVGKVTDFESKTRMPHFNFTHDQATAVAAIVLGYENKNVGDEAIFKVDGRWERIIEGQRQAHRMNCYGCHIYENRGGEILAHYQADPTEGPPNLNTEGQKVQTPWLQSFLLNPDVQIRPWLKVRMPTFLMNEGEAQTFTQFFAAHDNASYPFVLNAFDRPSPEGIKIAQQLIEKQGCLTCHAPRKPGQPVADAAPHFANVKYRLRGPWILNWVMDPQSIMPGTRMPTLFPPMDPDDPKSKHVAVSGFLGDDAAKQIEVIRNYLMVYPGDPELPSAPTHLKDVRNYTPAAR